MSIGLSKMTEDAEKLLDQGRLLPALELMKQARSMTKIPVRWLFLTFNIGVVYWDKLGDGISARSESMAAANVEGPEYDHPAARVLRANALENLMLCASSFDEFDDFTTRLRALAPEMPVVSGLPPAVHEMRDSGSPWSSVMFSLAMNNYNRNNPALDRGRYGVAKSTYDILLRTRKQQRLSREDWRMAVFEYCALAMRMATDCLNVRGGDADRNSPEEFLPILTDSLPLIDEYLATYTGDDDMRQVRNNMQSIVDNMRGRWTAIAPDAPDYRNVSSESGSRPKYRCRQCHKPVDDPMQACPSCGSPSPLIVVFPTILFAAAAAGALAWRFFAARAPWARGLFAVGAALFVLAVIGPIVFQVCLASIKEKNFQRRP